VQGNGLSIERRVLPWGTWLGVQGDLDLAAVGGTETWLSAEVTTADGDVAIDLSAVDFVGFAGIGLLDGLARRLAVHGRRLLLAASNPVVDRILELVGASDDRALDADGVDHVGAAWGGSWRLDDRGSGGAGGPSRAAGPTAGPALDRAER
jgi:anti-anti-sigma factor